jgi:hypothetical protein
MGNIGQPQRIHEIEPLETTPAPEEPAAPAPAAPEPVREPEEVPA